MTIVMFPPKSEMYLPTYRDRETKLIHSVLTNRRNYKTKATSRALCGIRVKGMWSRPPGSAVGKHCERCAGAVAALDELLSDD